MTYIGHALAAGAIATFALWGLNPIALALGGVAAVGAAGLYTGACDNHRKAKKALKSSQEAGGLFQEQMTGAALLVSGKGSKADVTSGDRDSAALEMARQAYERFDEFGDELANLLGLDSVMTEFIEEDAEVVAEGDHYPPVGAEEAGRVPAAQPVRIVQQLLVIEE